MSEKRADYLTVERCEECDGELASKGISGGLLVRGVPVLALAGNCPDCGHPFILPRSTGMEMNSKALERAAAVLRMIQEGGGFGTLTVRFEKHRVVRVGLGEMTFDVRCP